MNWKKGMKPVDFSAKHHMLVANDYDESIVHPMDEPYFESKEIAPRTWQVYSSGDMTYVAEGDEETLVIDSGYGAGDIRAYCQSLTDKPVYRIANTHDHFDHTANNYLFDCAYMSEKTYEKRTKPFPSFKGVEFPRDYPVVIIDEGYEFDLGNRTLETMSFRNHAMGSLGFLDRKARVFFVGDEFVEEQYSCRYSVAHGLAMYQKLMDHIDEFDLCAGGYREFDKQYIVKGYNALKRVLERHEEEWEPFASEFPEKPKLPSMDEPVTILRQAPRPWDRPYFTPDPEEDKYKRNFTLDGFTVSFDTRHIYE